MQSVGEHFVVWEQRCMYGLKCLAHDWTGVLCSPHPASCICAVFRGILNRLARGDYMTWSRLLQQYQFEAQSRGLNKLSTMSL